MITPLTVFAIMKLIIEVVLAKLLLTSPFEKED